MQRQDVDDNRQEKPASVEQPLPQPRSAGRVPVPDDAHKPRRSIRL